MTIVLLEKRVINNDSQILNIKKNLGLSAYYYNLSHKKNVAVLGIMSIGLVYGYWGNNKIDNMRGEIKDLEAKRLYELQKAGNNQDAIKNITLKYDGEIGYVNGKIKQRQNSIKATYIVSSIGSLILAIGSYKNHLSAERFIGKAGVVYFAPNSIAFAYNF